MTRWCKWTKAMDSYLRVNYGWIGDTRLAEMFEEAFPKHYPWTKKHIEKRRGYLGLKRTAEQESCLRVLNNKDGRQAKMWETRGAAKEGDTRIWKGRKYIKVDGQFVLYYRHITNAKPGQVVRSHEGTVQIIDRSTNQRLNAQIRASLPPELKQAVKALNKLKKVINGKENSRLTGDII